MDWKGSEAMTLGLSFPTLFHEHIGFEYLHLDMSGFKVEKALDRGIDAVAWHSQASERQKSRIILEITSDEPEIRLLYTTPESLKQGALREALKVRLWSGLTSHSPKSLTLL